MYLYLSFFTGFSNVESGEFALPGESIRQSLKYFYPNISLARIVALSSPDYTLDILAVIAGTAGLFLVTLIIATFTFQRGMASQLEEAKSSGGGRVEFVQNSAFKSLLLKEIREIIRSPGLAFYCIFQVVFAPLMISIYGNMDFSGGTATGGEDIIIKQGLSFFFATLMAIGINYTAMSSVSREGVTLICPKRFPRLIRSRSG
jgi:hypothetical protein